MCRFLGRGRDSMLALSMSLGAKAGQAPQRGLPLSFLILSFRAVPGPTGAAPHSQRE